MVTLLPPTRRRFSQGGIHGMTFAPTRSAASVTAMGRALGRLCVKAASLCRLPRTVESGTFFWYKPRGGSPNRTCSSLKRLLASESLRTNVWFIIRNGSVNANYCLHQLAVGSEMAALQVNAMDRL